MERAQNFDAIIELTADMISRFWRRSKIVKVITTANDGVAFEKATMDWIFRSAHALLDDEEQLSKAQKRAKMLGFYRQFIADDTKPDKWRLAAAKQYQDIAELTKHTDEDEASSPDQVGEEIVRAVQDLKGRTNIK